MTDTLKIISQLIADKLEVDVETIKPESNLTELGMDSLDTFDIIFSAEDTFNIKVPNDKVDIATVQDVANLADALISEQHPK
ncbi:acyl carrier protein [Methyloradius palustris]|uniref:Acyl carrier protein n=1 Tax=Methyloradius palustris TaxID=2778876 RepID=A0A8D5GD76_9PROT|nr:acyl carrier protein [Methyloradius palustris]BCM26131.1 acyl carrier protein [Methyloradius palustris]